MNEDDNVLLKLLFKRVYILIVLIIVLFIIFIVLWMEKMGNDEKDKETIVIDYVCLPDENALRSSIVFKANCSACHSATDRKIIGPGLGGLNNRLPSQEWIRLYLTNEDSLYRLNDPYFLDLKDSSDIKYNHSTLLLSEKDLMIIDSLVFNIN